MRTRLGVLPFVFLLLCLAGLSACQPIADETTAGTGAGGAVEWDGPPSHDVDEVAPGVYFAYANGTVNLVSNAMFVVNDEDVLVVDSHITADAARGLIHAVRSVTDKPIEFLVNSHYHYDHAHGNQEFAGDSLIIGHEYTREKLLGPVLEESTYQTIGHPDYERTAIAFLQEQAGGAEGDAKVALENQIAMMERHVKALAEVVPTPPNVTLTEKMTLHRGDREIQLLHLGRGHTGGDVLTYLPKEKLVFTGDLLYSGAPYFGDGFVNEYADTLEELKKLDIEMIVPGHGPVVTDLSQIDFAQEYSRKYWVEVKALHAQGLTAKEAASKVEMAGYEDYAVFQRMRPEVRLLEVTRMFELLDEGAE